MIQPQDMFIGREMLKIGKIKVMNKFAENNPERLKEFALKLNELYDEYHPNLYLIDEVYAGVDLILTGIVKKLKEDEI